MSGYSACSHKSSITMLKRPFRRLFLLIVLCAASGATVSCGAEPDHGGNDAAANLDGGASADAAGGQQDAGVPDGGMDGGTDGGVDGGTDAAL